jgi:hypothetical protein
MNEKCKDTLFQHIIKHMHHKYGVNGYLRIWLNLENDVQGLQEIRSKLTLKDDMRNDFDRIWEMLRL